MTKLLLFLVIFAIWIVWVALKAIAGAAAGAASAVQDAVAPQLETPEDWVRHLLAKYQLSGEGLKNAAELATKDLGSNVSWPVLDQWLARVAITLDQANQSVEPEHRMNLNSALTDPNWISTMRGENALIESVLDYAERANSESSVAIQNFSTHPATSEDILSGRGIERAK